MRTFWPCRNPGSVRRRLAAGARADCEADVLFESVDALGRGGGRLSDIPSRGVKALSVLSRVANGEKRI